MDDFLLDVRQKLSKESKILTRGDREFGIANKRWTDIDRDIAMWVSGFSFTSRHFLYQWSLTDCSLRILEAYLVILVK